MRVLIAIDGSKASEVVLQEALTRPWPTGSAFCLITVVDPFFFTKAPSLLDEARGVAGQFLKDAAVAFEEKGWNVTVEVVLGNPRRAVSECAEEWHADLVLVGSQGLNALARLALGSTVKSVLRHTKCSVEIVRKPQDTPEGGAARRRILVATDGSEFSTRALSSIAERPWPEGTEVKIISVPEFTTWLGDFPSFPLGQVEKLNKSALDAAKAAVALGEEILSKKGFRVTASIAFEAEAPAKTILDEARDWKADLLVVGSHGRRGFDRFAMGSVSESVAMNAPCSVEVVHAQTNHEKRGGEEVTYESQRDHDGHAIHVS
jgi:nucleotide-binding universal stress UspA family protein